MANEDLIIPKELQPVVLWVHPEGRVLASLFAADGERPVDVLNAPGAFVVVRLEGSGEIRFYQRSSIVRVEHEDPEPPEPAGMILHRCEVQMMDGSLIAGTLRRPAPPDRSRLFDFLNRREERFLEIFDDGGPTILVNKPYVVFVTEAG